MVSNGFSGMLHNNVTSGSIRRYLDDNRHRAASANREVAALSAAWSWWLEREDIRGINPARELRDYLKSHRPD
jgi:site-specific recombinase XerD